MCKHVENGQIDGPLLAPTFSNSNASYLPMIAMSSGGIIAII